MILQWRYNRCSELVFGHSFRGFVGSGSYYKACVADEYYCNYEDTADEDFHSGLLGWQPGSLVVLRLHSASSQPHTSIQMSIVQDKKSNRTVVYFHNNDLLAGGASE